MRTSRMSFGKYQVLARLGQGGMGHVYLAMNAGPAGVQKLVVIKQLREDFATSVAARAMFLDEARISMRLNHPNIVQVNEVVDDEDDLYLVMEFLDGQPLSRILEPSHTGAFPLGTKLWILVEALEGLHYAHELTDYDGTPMNVVHRDVSPQNVIVTYDGHVKLVDFGVAKAADAKSVTESGVFKGKIRYASPEQALCTPVDRRADVFALGTVLWEVLTGRRLWQDQADASVLLALASGQIPKLRDALPEVPPALEAICTKALATDVSQRYPTALALRDALAEYLAAESKATDIGRALSLSFDSERRRLHGVIDAQMKAARDTSAGPLTVRNIPLLGPDSAGNLSNSSASEKSVVRGGLSIESEARSRRPVAEETASSHGKSIALAALAVLAIIAGIGYLVPSKTPPKMANAAVPVAAASSPPLAPPAPRIHMSLHAAPPEARFLLDGRALATNPYEEDVTPDEAPHRISIRADGFETRDMDARLNRDMSLDVTLAPRAAAIPAPPAPITAAVPVAAPDRRGVTRTPPTQKGSSQRRIDEDDPYKP